MLRLPLWRYRARLSEHTLVSLEVQDETQPKIQRGPRTGLWLLVTAGLLLWFFVWEARNVPAWLGYPLEALLLASATLAGLMSGNALLRTWHLGAVSMSSPRSPASWVLACALTIAALAITGYSWQQRLTSEHWHTGARRVVWDAPEVRPDDRYPPWDACGSLTGEWLLAGRFLWSWCRGDEITALGRIDLDELEGDMHWIFPEESQPTSLEGVMPSGKGQLAIAYRSDLRLGIAVAGDDGWVFAPRSIPDSENVHLLGMRWSGHDVELALKRSGVGNDDVFVRRLSALDTTVRPNPPLCGDSRTCYVSAAWGDPEKDGWCWLLSRDDASFSVCPERGHEVEHEERTIALFGQPESSVTGRVDTLGFERPSASLRLDGTLDPFSEPPPSLPSATLLGGRYLADGRLVPQWAWRDRDAGVTAFESNGQSVMLSLIAGDRQHIGLAKRGSDPNIIARVESYACAELYDGALVRRGDGYVLMSAGGCYVLLDDALRRADPLTVGEHLLRRGSQFLEAKETRHLWRLRWACCGYPLTLLVFLLLAWWAHRERWPIGDHAVAAASVFFCITGGWALMMVLPLMG